MSIDFYEHIEPYRNGELKGQELEAFEAALKDDPELKRTLENYPVIMELLEFAMDNEVHAELSEIRRNENANHTADKNSAMSKQVSEKPKSEFILGKVQKIAIAAMIVALVCAYPLWTGFQETSPQQLYATYYETYPNLMDNTRGEIHSEGLQAIRKEAYDAYNRADFEKVIELLVGINRPYPQELEDAFYLGISYLEVNDTQEATALFSQIALSENFYSDDSRWYLALSLLKSGECNAARKQFEEIYNMGKTKLTESKLILRELKCT